MTRPLLLGHRGARAVKSIRENTVASFDRALADGCDGFEFDVRLTADGEAVIWHDPKAGRVEVARAKARQLPRLARLEEILARYQDRAFLDIELKVAGLEKIALDLLRQHPPRRGYVISSFLPEVLEALRAEDRAVYLGLICFTKKQLQHWPEIPCDYVIPHHRLLNMALLRRIRAGKKKVLVWTLNSAAGMRRFAKRGVDGIISDKTSRLRVTLRG